MAPRVVIQEVQTLNQAAQETLEDPQKEEQQYFNEDDLIEEVIDSDEELPVPVTVPVRRGYLNYKCS